MFEQQIHNFVNYGSYDYQFDEVGNLILNPSSSIFQQHYFPFDLHNVVYDSAKVLSFYDPTLKEFTKPSATNLSNQMFEMQEYIDNINKENQDLKKQLDDVIALTDSNAKDVSDQNSIKDTIIGLRISLGQGKELTDFYTTFPYLPLTSSDRSSGETTVEEMLSTSPQPFANMNNPSAKTP